VVFRGSWSWSCKNDIGYTAARSAHRLIAQDQFLLCFEMIVTRFMMSVAYSLAGQILFFNRP